MKWLPKPPLESQGFVTLTIFLKASYAMIAGLLENNWDESANLLGWTC